MESRRCFGDGNPKYEKYHDDEWGVPVHDERKLFEMLILEGAHAGLSWELILNKREKYKKAFDNFDVKKVASYDDKKREELMQDKGIVRNRLKIFSATKNAKAFIKIQKEFGSFDKYIWSFVNNKTIISKRTEYSEMPSNNEISDAISKDLKKRGMSFVGSTIIYAYMQAIGMVNDHFVWCSRHKELGG